MALNNIFKQLVDTQAASKLDPVKFEKLMDDTLASFASLWISSSLRNNRLKGRHGWWDAEVCTLGELYSMLQENVDDKNLESVINIAAMIKARESMVGKGSAMPAD